MGPGRRDMPSMGKPRRSFPQLAHDFQVLAPDSRALMLACRTIETLISSRSRRFDKVPDGPFSGSEASEVRGMPVRAERPNAVVGQDGICHGLDQGGLQECSVFRKICPDSVMILLLAGRIQTRVPGCPRDHVADLKSLLLPPVTLRTNTPYVIWRWNRRRRQRP